ncbi:MAG: DUF2520 domain-containing protein [Cytophagales bacterium]|nr:DUF2520 domain-containing protein [Cytophagales bacterium]
MDISFIGSGNLAWHLAPAFDNAGHVVREVFSRNQKHAEMLTGRLYQAVVKTSLDFSQSKSRVFFIAVNDDSIEKISTEIVLPENACLIHTSGSQPLEVLQFAAATACGVFYPLQTFTRNKRIDFKSIPLFIESDGEASEKILMTLAKAVSENVRKITSEERKALHVAAVFASNFSNHMLTVAKKILAESSLDFALLKPLILETITKSLSLGPEESQTGPAMRSDLEILDHHVAFLKNDDRVAELYKIISQHILDTYGSP